MRVVFWNLDKPAGFSIDPTFFSRDVGHACRKYRAASSTFGGSLRRRLLCLSGLDRAGRADAGQRLYRLGPGGRVLADRRLRFDGVGVLHLPEWLCRPAALPERTPIPRLV